MPVHDYYNGLFVTFDELAPEGTLVMRKATFDSLLDATIAPLPEPESPSVPTEEGIDESPDEDVEEQ